MKLLLLPNNAGFGGNLGGSPSRDFVQLTCGAICTVLLVATVYWWYLEDTDDLGAEHSDGAVDGGVVEVGVIIVAHGSNPRL